MSSNTAAVHEKPGAPFSITKREIPKPQAYQLLIRNRALATNPVDWKIQEHGFFITKLPNVLGSDISGTVEAVGEGVTHFKKGDRVAAFAGVIASNNIDEGAFQEYTIVYENVTTKLPEHISFEEGAVLPMAVATAGVAIFPCLEIPRPTSGHKESGGFLVWGGSASVGTAAVQIAKSLGFTVFAVSSPHHHHYINKLGATATFNYNDSQVVNHIISAAKSHGVEIKYAFDSVSEASSLQQVVRVLQAFGGGSMCITLPWPNEVEKPADVTVVNTGSYRILVDLKEFGGWLFNDWLAESLANKTYVPSPSIEIIEGGISSVQKAVNLHKQGLSGKKLVVSLA